MPDEGRESRQARHYAEAVETFGPALERLAVAYERDADRRTSCIEFYRAGLVRQRDPSKDAWGYLLPFVPGMALGTLDGVLEARPLSQKVMLVTIGNVKGR